MAYLPFCEWFLSVIVWHFQLHFSSNCGYRYQELDLVVQMFFLCLVIQVSVTIEASQHLYFRAEDSYKIYSYSIFGVE